MLKKSLCAILCVVMLLTLAACNKNDAHESQPDPTYDTIVEPTDQTENNNSTTEPTKENDPVDETETNPTEATKPSKPVDDDTEQTKPTEPDKLQLYDDEYGLIEGFNGKIEKLLKHDYNLVFYADDGIYHQVEDENDNKVLHKFNIGPVDEILYYACPNVYLYGNITPELCVYTRTDDEKVYVSITDDSKDFSLSNALTFSVDIKPENIKFAQRDSDEVFLVYVENGNAMCYHYDARKNELLGNEIIVGKLNDENIRLKSIESDGSGCVAITDSDVLHLVQGGEVEEWDGEYYVDLYEKYKFENAKSMFDNGIDDIYVMTNDDSNLHAYIFSSGQNITHVKIRIPNGFKLTDITNHWGLDDCCVIQFKDGSYYLFEEISSFETDEYIDMEKLDIDPSINVDGFVCSSWDLLVLSDGFLYVCKENV